MTPQKKGNFAAMVETAPCSGRRLKREFLPDANVMEDMRLIPRSTYQRWLPSHPGVSAATAKTGTSLGRLGAQAAVQLGVVVLRLDRPCLLLDGLGSDRADP